MSKYYINIRINKNLDKQVCQNFINTKIGGFDFGKERIIDLHPKLNKARSENKKERSEIINSYIDAYYKNHRQKIIETKKFINAVWQEIENDYFKEVEKLFNNKVYLKNKNFTAFISIFSCSPLIEPQGWQIYYKIKSKSEIKRIFAHEILHFFYYSYIKNNRVIKLYYSNLEQEDHWIKAELFNVAILNRSSFQKIIGRKEKGYNIHKKYFSTFKNNLEKSKNLNDYLIKSARLKLK
jgi:hypothetical protein